MADVVNNSAGPMTNSRTSSISPVGRAAAIENEELAASGSSSSGAGDDANADAVVDNSAGPVTSSRPLKDAALGNEQLVTD